jgi:hypothetical protein
MKSFRKKLFFLTVAALLETILTFGLVGPVNAATFSPADTAELISAINKANGNSEADVINLTANTTYTLTAAIPATINGLPQITTEITINGKGATITRDTAATDKFRIFKVAASGKLTLNNTAISGGELDGTYDSTASGAGIYNEGTLEINQCRIEHNQADPDYGAGGGVANLGQLTVTGSTISQNLGLVGSGITNKDGTVTCTDSEISSNVAMMGCGLVNLDGSMTLANCNISQNQLPANPPSDYRMGGGGITNLASSTSTSATLVLTDCTLDGNNNLYGGGIANGLIETSGNNVITGGTVTINRCTISHNKAISGAGLSNLLGTINIVNSTISGNIIEAQTATARGAGWDQIYNTGGGCINLGQMSIDSCTVCSNSAETGGGIYTIDSSSDPNYDIFIKIKNTIIAGNSATAGPDCSGPFKSYGYNLVGSQPGDPAEYTFSEEENHGTDIFGQDPLLRPLADNGGPTLTHALRENSPAIEHGSCTRIDGSPVAEDQRGEIRPHLDNGSCDIGAYECPCPDGTGVPTQTQDSGPNHGAGNGDGILDSRQRTVASLPAAAGAGYLTVEIIGSGCGQLSQVKSLSPNSIGTPDPGYTYPFGLVSFSIDCPSVTVRIYFHGTESLDELTYRKFGPTPTDWNTSSWYTMPGAEYGSKTIGDVSVPYVELTLTEGELGDDTNTPPIIDAGGPASAAAVPTLNEWGLIIMTLLLSGFFLAAINRRQGLNKLL